MKLTPSEHFLRLWQALGGGELFPEFPFHDTRKWRFDFAQTFVGVAIEIEGGTFAGRPCPACGQRKGGRHNRGASFARDCEKYREAAFLGWLVFRFTTPEITAENVERLVKFCAFKAAQKTSN